MKDVMVKYSEIYGRVSDRPELKGNQSLKRRRRHWKLKRSLRHG